MFKLRLIILFGQLLEFFRIVSYLLAIVFFLAFALSIPIAIISIAKILFDYAFR